MAFSSTLTDDWSGAMYRGKRAPANAVYDVLNGLVNDEGQLFKRGGSAYKSNANAGAALLGLADVFVSAGRRTIFTSSDYPTAGSWVLDADDETPIALPFAWWQGARLVAASGVAFVPADSMSGCVLMYAGSRKSAGYSAGTVTVTNGSDQITGSSTSWLANVDAGMIIFVDGNTNIVKSVDSDTAITLTGPYKGTGGSGKLYDADGIAGLAPSVITDYSGSTQSGEGVYVTAVGASARLIVAVKQRAFVSGRGDPFTFDPADYLELPSDAEIIGADALGSTALLFTSRGIWAIGNLDFDDVDDYGNQQWTLQQINKDLVLWGDPGVASWTGKLVVPAVDDVWLFSSGAQPSTITGARGSQYDGGIRNLYRSYVGQGFQPGTATVHRSHYILPILDGTDLVDVLVCRLDHGFAWTRWSAGAAGVSYARRIGSDTRSPKLLGLAGERVTDLTGCFDPSASNATDADGTAPTFQVTTRDYPTGQQPGFVDRVRARYEMVGLGIPDTFDRPDGDIGPDWTTPVWGDSNSALEIASHELAGNSAGHDSRSYYTADPQVAPLATGFTFKARPAGNVDTFVYAIIGFRRTDTTSGYEVRFRFESAADQVAIYRYDGGSATRILDPVALGGRLAADDTFGFSVGTDGTISALVNNAVVGSVTDTTHFHAGEAGYALAGVVDVTGVQSLIRLDGAAPAVVDVEFSSDQDGGVFTALTERGEQFGGTGWTVSDGSKYQFAKVGKKRERIRFRVTVAGACTSFVLRSIEMLTRPSGRQ